ncbi:MAG: acylhydrolase [Porphyromonadaceae bacterium CG2_30_38_12]|nr:MAG: acylhydrolase [Porphyromonadaceae bacterium CG2_30_38_12]
MNSKKTIKLLFTSTLLLSSLFVNAQDWPDLNRYKAENSLLKSPVNGEKRVVFMGNSITEAWKNSSPEFFTNNPYICRGISGQTTPQMLVRFRQDVISLQPKVVVILAGTNDIAGNTGTSTLEMIQDNLASMAELANANGIRVVLSSVLPVLDYPWKKGLEPAEKIITLNAWINTYCEKKGFIYLDYFTPMANEKHGMKAELTNDGVHCTAAGYAVMEPLAQKAIKLALKHKPRK